MKGNYTIVNEKNAPAGGDNRSDLLLNTKKHKIFRASWLIPALLMLFIYPLSDKTQSAPVQPQEGCGAHTSFLLAGDSLMIAYQLLTGATNYSLSLRRSSGGQWLSPTGDVASGCSKLGYFVLYLRDKPNGCQHYMLQPGAYIYKITAFNDQIADSCVMQGDFNLTDKQVWKTTYSTWDVYNRANLSGH